MCHKGSDELMMIGLRYDIGTSINIYLRKNEHFRSAEPSIHELMDWAAFG